MTAIDRRLNWMLGAVAVVTALTLVLAIAIYPKASTGADNTAAQLRSDAIGACRASYSADVSSAQVQLQRAQAHSNELIRQGFAAVALNDRDLLREVASQAAGASAEIAAALDMLDAAAERYADSVQRSQQNPDRFLERCRADGRSTDGSIPTTTAGD